MEMECDLLISDLKNPKTIGQMKEGIEHVSDGSSTYCGGVLKLGFKKAFELKKRERGVLLRCFNSNCGRHNNPFQYSTVGSNIYCPHCIQNNGYGYDSYGNYVSRSTRYYFQCVGCGYQRTGGYASCQSCGKRFL